MSSNSSKNYFNRALTVLTLFVWVITGFIMAQYAVVLLSRAALDIVGYTGAISTNPLLQLVISACVYMVALAVIVGVPKLILETKKISLKKELGIDKGPELLTLAYGPLGYVIYFFVTIFFGLLIQLLWRDFPIDEVQQVGFDGLSSTVEYVMAFTALVIIAPIAEELLFRGYFYGKVRAISKFWVSAIVTSALFGLVHWQWNVGVDVFALSLVLCALREYTGTIWAGIAVHMIKNTVAFTILFLQPGLLDTLIAYFSR
jgi:uncharacterized protein